jgi:hypothetical protein
MAWVNYRTTMAEVKAENNNENTTRRIWNWFIVLLPRTEPHFMRKYDKFKRRPIILV